MGEDLRTAVVHTGGIVLLSVAGEVDIATRDRFEAGLAEAVGAAIEAVEVDLGAVTYFGSQGVRGLLRASELAMERGVSLSVVACTPTTRRVFDITGSAHLVASPLRVV